MKKLIATIFVAIMMLAMGTVSVFAEISPTAPPSTEPPKGPSTSPQTGDSTVLFVTSGVLMTAAASVLAVKKIKE